jgi:hypothetical protein
MVLTLLCVLSFVFVTVGHAAQHAAQLTSSHEAVVKASAGSDHPSEPSMTGLGEVCLGCVTVLAIVDIDALTVVQTEAERYVASRTALKATPPPSENPPPIG